MSVTTLYQAIKEENMKKDIEDHEVVEKAEKWWKSKTKMFQVIVVIAVVLVGYNWFFGGM